MTDVGEWVFKAAELTDQEIEQATYMTPIAKERQEGVSTVGQQQRGSGETNA